MIAGKVVAAIYLNIHVPSRGPLYGNYVINPIWTDQDIYKMDAGTLAVIAIAYVIINERKMMGYGMVDAQIL